MDTSHLVALHTGLLHEQQRLANAKTDGERALRTVWVHQYERQIADEEARLGIKHDATLKSLSADELFAELQK